MKLSFYPNDDVRIDWDPDFDRDVLTVVADDSEQEIPIVKLQAMLLLLEFAKGEIE